MAEKGLRSWVKENGSILRTKNRMAHTEMWKKWWRKRKIIQNACPLQKQERCPAGNVRVPYKKTSEIKYWPDTERAATFAQKEKSCKWWINR